jgi:hypothetical protein
MGLAINQQITNTGLFNTIVEESLAKAANYSRWQNAINKGVTQMQLNGEFMTWDADEKGLVIWSQESNKVYASNGVCQCKAFEQGQPCWHRALARLARLYFEADTRSDRNEMDTAIYSKTQVKSEKIGGFRI